MKKYKIKVDFDGETYEYQIKADSQKQAASIIKDYIEERMADGVNKWLNKRHKDQIYGTGTNQNLHGLKSIVK